MHSSSRLIPSKTPLFDGSELSVIFVRSILAPNFATGLEVVQIAAVSNDFGSALVRSTAPIPIGLAQSDGTELVFTNPVVVMRGPYHFSFSYAGSDRVWRDNWHNEAQLPRAVRVTLRDNATSVTLTTSTSTSIHAEMPARCTWAQASTDCPELEGQKIWREITALVWRAQLRRRPPVHRALPARQARRQVLPLRRHLRHLAPARYLRRRPGRP